MSFLTGLEEQMSSSDQLRGRQSRARDYMFVVEYSDIRLRFFTVMCYNEVVMDRRSSFISHTVYLVKIYHSMKSVRKALMLQIVIFFLNTA